MKQLKKVWQFSMPELLSTMGGLAALGLFGILLVFIIVKIGGAEIDDYAMMGGFLAFMPWVLLEIWVGMVNYGKNFGMMVSMSRTRKEFYGTYLVTSIINSCLKMLVIVGIVLLEKAVAAAFYKGLACELDLSSFILDYRVIIGAILLSVGLRMLFGVLYLKYQMIMFWVLWGLTMFAGLGLNMLSKVLHNPSMEKVTAFFVKLIEKIAQAGGLVHVLLLAAVSAIMVFAAGMINRKQAVKC